jgi:hypothetical protein
MNERRTPRSRAQRIRLVLIGLILSVPVAYLIWVALWAFILAIGRL